MVLALQTSRRFRSWVDANPEGLKLAVIVIEGTGMSELATWLLSGDLRFHTWIALSLAAGSCL
jgi:hypothetical protein